MASGFDWRWALEGEAVPGLPVFCLERWQSTYETTSRMVLSESGVEPPSPGFLREIGLDLSLEEADLGYGWTLGSPRLREAIAQGYYNGLARPDRIIVATGSAEANLLTVFSTVAEGDTVVVDMPNYMQIPGLARLRGARVVEAWRRAGEHWMHDPAMLLDIVRSHRPRAVFITNPNNPTGSIVPLGLIRELAREAAAVGAVLVFDEVYRGLEHEGGETPTVLEAAMGEGATAVSVSGLSKAYGLPGLRIGWAATNDEALWRRMWAVKDYTTISPSRLSEALAIRVLETGAGRRLVERARMIAGRNIRELERVVSGSRLRPWRPMAGAFVLARVEGFRDTRLLAERLVADHGILVVPGECFRLPGTLRIGAGRESLDAYRREIRELIEAIEAIAREPGACGS